MMLEGLAAGTTLQGTFTENILKIKFECKIFKICYQCQSSILSLSK